MSAEVTLTDAEREALRGLGQGQVPAIVERIIAARVREVEAERDGWKTEAARRHRDWMAAATAAQAEWEAERDAMLALASAVETIKQTGGAVEISEVRIEPCDEYGATDTTKRAEAAEAKVARVEALADDWADSGLCPDCAIDPEMLRAALRDAP